MWTQEEAVIPDKPRSIAQVCTGFTLLQHALNSHGSELGTSPIQDRSSTIRLLFHKARCNCVYISMHNIVKELMINVFSM